MSRIFRLNGPRPLSTPDGVRLFMKICMLTTAQVYSDNRAFHKLIPTLLKARPR
jgi:hypothetical protein